jgi:hypothetical protein
MLGTLRLRPSTWNASGQEPHRPDYVATRTRRQTLTTLFGHVLSLPDLVARRNHITERRLLLSGVY